MGPTGVIGDAFFQTGGFRIISASIGASMCIAGNPFGLLLYFLIYNVPNYLVHWWGIHQGFKTVSYTHLHSLTIFPAYVSKVSTHYIWRPFPFNIKVERLGAERSRNE